MASETGSRVDTSFDPVAGQILSPVRGTTVSVGLVLQGRFKFNPGTMAIGAEALPVAHGADLFVLPGFKAMVLGKIDVMVIAFESDDPTGLVMAIGADRSAPWQFLRMAVRQLRGGSRKV